MSMGLMIAFVVGFVTAAIVGAVVVPFLRKVKAGQMIKEIGPNWHMHKNGTPTMGGVIFIAAVTAACMTAGWSNVQAGEYGHLGCLLLAFAFGVVGFIDDYEKLRHKQNLGLTDDIVRKILKADILDDFTDDVLRVIKNYNQFADDIIDLVKNYGKTIPDVISKYGDDAVEILLDYGDTAAKLIQQYGDDATEALIKYGDEAYNVLKEYEDDAAEGFKAGKTPDEIRADMKAAEGGSKFITVSQDRLQHSVLGEFNSNGRLVNGGHGQANIDYLIQNINQFQR